MAEYHISKYYLPARRIKLKSFSSLYWVQLAKKFRNTNLGAKNSEKKYLMKYDIWHTCVLTCYQIIFQNYYTIATNTKSKKVLNYTKLIFLVYEKCFCNQIQKHVVQISMLTPNINQF